ncbi:MAG TPA: hypothetical protein DEV72_02600 [Ktedonobacter sp.]|nr:hypothetical protein [Ktedonobacter sp.]
MSRQFEPSSSSQGASNQPEQQSPTGNSSPTSAGALPDMFYEHAREERSPAISVGQRPAGKGLLSSFRTSQTSQPSGGADLHSTSLVEQDTLKQPAIQPPFKEITTNPAHVQNFPWVQVAPHQSGVTPLANMHANVQNVPVYGATSMPGTTPAPTSLQSFQPFVASSQSSLPETFDRVAFHPTGSSSMPQSWAGWQGQPMPVGYQSPGLAAAQPFVQGPVGQSALNGRRKKKRRFPIWARVVVAILTVFIILGGTLFYYYQVNFAAPVSTIIGQTAPRLKSDEAPNQGRSDSTGGILGGGRINILLLGSDDDYKSVHIYGGILAQTDIVVSIDPATQSVSMLSIPRDAWVNVPGYGMHKLDQAFLLGGGGAKGAALSMATIHQDFGVYIDHYAWVGLSGFTKVINTVGGVDVDVIHPITDDSYPDDTGKGALDPFALKRLYIAPGPQHLMDLPALEYVRSRHADLVGDFGRSVRQQQVLNQLKYKLDNPNVIGQLPALAQDLNGAVKTDMSLQDVFKLIYYAKSVDQSKINKVTLGPPYSGDKTINTDSGMQDVVILNCARLQPLIAKMFAIGNSAKCDQASSGNGFSTASTLQTSPASSAVATAPGTSSWRAVHQIAEVSTMSLGGTNYDFLGIHSLLDLLFLVVFESPAALQV